MDNQNDFDQEFIKLIERLDLPEVPRPEAFYLTDLANLAATMNAVSAVINKFIADTLLVEDGAFQISEGATYYIGTMGEAMTKLLEIVVEEMVSECDCEDCSLEEEEEE